MPMAISRLIDSGIRLRSFLSLKAEMNFARALGIDVLVFQYVPPSAQAHDSPGSTGLDLRDKHVVALERLGDDIELLLEQVPNVILAIENSVCPPSKIS
jgi:hypothetical protein